MHREQSDSVLCGADLAGVDALVDLLLAQGDAVAGGALHCPLRPALARRPAAQAAQRPLLRHILYTYTPAAAARDEGGFEVMRSAGECARGYSVLLRARMAAADAVVLCRA
jgi:hypothetical protein